MILEDFELLPYDAKIIKRKIFNDNDSYFTIEQDGISVYGTTNFEELEVTVTEEEVCVIRRLFKVPTTDTKVRQTNGEWMLHYTFKEEEVRRLISRETKISILGMTASKALRSTFLKYKVGIPENTTLHDFLIKEMGEDWFFLIEEKPSVKTF